MALKFNPYKNINPQIYAYTTPHVTTNDGWIKIGYTEKQSVEARVKQQCHTANIDFDIKWHEDNVTVTVSGSEQDDNRYILSFDGTVE